MSIDNISVCPITLERLKSPVNPEDHQPSLNLKVTDDAKNQLGDSSIIMIYAVNYNILRIMGGMGEHAGGVAGLAYSN